MYGVKRILLCVALAALVLLQPAAAGSSIVVEDALHRTVVIPRAPERVVSLAPSITEILFALGLEDRLVGVDSISYNDSYYGISGYVRGHGVESVGGYWWSTISVEKILSLSPDLVLADAGAHVKLLDTFSEYNMTVVYLHGGSASSIQDIYMDISTVARVFNLSEDTVSKLISDIEENLTKARGLLEGLAGRRVIVVVGFYNGIWVAGKATFIDDLLSRLGLANAVDGVGWRVASIEDLIAWSPDLIIVTSMGGVTNETLSEYGIYSVSSHVILLTPRETDLITRPGPLIGYGAVLLANRIAETLGAAHTTTTTTSTTTTTTTTTTTATAGESGGAAGGNWLGYPVIVAAVAALAIGFILGLAVRRARG